MHDDEKYQFLANLTSLQNGAPEFIKINFFSTHVNIQSISTQGSSKEKI